MPVHDFRSERLFVDAPMGADLDIACSRDQHNYLCNVLRLKAGDEILVFNGRDGEWRARLMEVSKRGCQLRLGECVRAQQGGGQIDYLFAPLRRARLDYMVQKAVEMGVANLRPVFTHHTVVSRVNVERMSANVVEAAEQCGILEIARVHEPTRLKASILGWPRGQPLIFADEDAELSNPIDVLKTMQPGPVGVLVGPEGGFSREERLELLAQPFVKRISLGPRVMRSDTAAVAMLALVNACLGDWR